MTSDATALKKRYAFVLHGDTFPHKDVLWRKGFRWDRTHKVWVSELSKDVAANDELRAYVRTLQGVSSTMELAERFPVLHTHRWYNSNY